MGGDVNVLAVCDGAVERHGTDDLPRLLKDPDAVIWVDIPVCDKVAAEVLLGIFGFDRIAVRECVERNHVSKLHVYDDNVFTVLHTPPHG